MFNTTIQDFTAEYSRSTASCQALGFHNAFTDSQAEVRAFRTKVEGSEYDKMDSAVCEGRWQYLVVVSRLADSQLKPLVPGDVAPPRASIQYSLLQTPADRDKAATEGWRQS